MEPIVFILLSLAAAVLFLELAYWILRIAKAIRYLRVIGYLLKSIAEKQQALSENQVKWVDDQLK